MQGGKLSHMLALTRMQGAEQGLKSLHMRRGRAEIEGMMAIVVRGDAMSPDDVAKAFGQIEQVDAVVSTIGGTPADPNADSQAREPCLNSDLNLNLSPTCAARRIISRIHGT